MERHNQAVIEMLNPAIAASYPIPEMERAIDDFGCVLFDQGYRFFVEFDFDDPVDEDDMPNLILEWCKNIEARVMNSKSGPTEMQAKELPDIKALYTIVNKGVNAPRQTFHCQCKNVP